MIWIVWNNMEITAWYSTKQNIFFSLFVCLFCFVLFWGGQALPSICHHRHIWPVRHQFKSCMQSIWADANHYNIHMKVKVIIIKCSPSILCSWLVLRHSSTGVNSCSSLHWSASWTDRAQPGILRGSGLLQTASQWSCLLCQWCPLLLQPNEIQKQHY